MKTKLLKPLGSFILMILLLGSSQVTSAQSNMYNLYRNSYRVIDAQRLPNGMYIDAKVIRPGWTDYHPVSVANVGVGLVSLAIAHQAGFDNNAEAKVIETLRTILGLTPGYNPDRNASGYYRHFIDPQTGAQAWNSEYSTIDAAILVSGALFAKMYFSWNGDIAYYAEQLFNTINWSRSIANASQGELYREMNAAGYGIGGITRPFNEYMILAYLAMRAEFGSNGPATQAWNVWTDLDAHADANYWGYPLLTDSPTGSAFISHFTIQFPYYYVNWATNNAKYASYMTNAMNADQLYYQNLGNNAPYEWGLGAGSIDGGYNADAINDHPQQVVSPHIMAGFIPVKRGIYWDLNRMRRNNKGKYTLPSGTPFIWRYSLENPTWKADEVIGIDYSTMLYGLAHYYLGDNFFSTYNNFIIPNPNARSTELEEGKELEQRLVVYPNPVKDVFTTEFNMDQAGSIKIELFDLTGRRVILKTKSYQNSGVQKYTEDISALPKGEYVVRYTIGGEVTSKRISKTE